MRLQGKFEIDHSWSYWTCSRLSPTAYTSRRKVLPVFEVPSNPDFINQEPQEAMERNVREADGILLLTDQPVYGVPQYLDSVRKYLINGHLFSWNLYGVRCVLLGGSVHKRKVAMQLRHLLEDSSNLLVGRVLPQPCFLKKLYAVDPQVETEGPCVLWSSRLWGAEVEWWNLLITFAENRPWSRLVSRWVLMI